MEEDVYESSPALLEREVVRDVGSFDIAVVGGGPSGMAAAVAAARAGRSVVLLERYPYLGGLAAGGMVLLLDDMTAGQQQTVKGLAQEFIERLEAFGMAVTPPPRDRNNSAASVERWRTWGFQDPYSRTDPPEVVYAATFDPEGWKLAANQLVRESGVTLRLQSTFLRPILEDNRVAGVVTVGKSGLERVRAEVVIDATGDADVAWMSGAEVTSGSFLVTTVFRLGNVDTRAAEEFEFSGTGESHEVMAEVRRRLAGSWSRWWLRTPIPGVVWCNCPHMSRLDATSIEDLTFAELTGRDRIWHTFEYIRANHPGFESSYIVDVAPQLGVRQSRLLRGEYVVTHSDISSQVRFEDTIARGRDYFTPFRALLPTTVEQLLVPGRHYSADPAAQRISREIPPCMAMGEAAGIAASLSIESSVMTRDLNVGHLQKRLTAVGLDIGEASSKNNGRDRNVPI